MAVNNISKGSSGKLMPNPPPILSNSMERGMINERNYISKSDRKTAATNTKTTKGKTLNHSKPSHKAIILSKINPIPML